jgi:membrane protein involved in colicin uptake
MTISKLTPFLCVLAFGAMSLCAGAEDSATPAAVPANQLSATNSVSGPDAKAKAKADKAAAQAKAKADKAAAQAKAKAKADAAKAAASQGKPAAGSVPAAMVATDLAGNGPGRMQIVAPAVPISAAKAERLKVLLGKYQADQITPTEYHQQRAAILAEP